MKSKTEPNLGSTLVESAWICSCGCFMTAMHLPEDDLSVCCWVCGGHMDEMLDPVVPEQIPGQQELVRADAGRLRP